MKAPEKPGIPPTRGQGVGMILFGLLFAAGGAFIEWLSFVSPAKQVSAPPWVTGFAGLIFILPGLAFVIGGLQALFRMRSDAETDRIYRGVFMAAMLWLFAMAFGGVAFLGESSAFSGGITGSSMEARILFGIAGVAIAIFAFMFTVVVLGVVTARNQKDRAAKAADSGSGQNGPSPG